MKAEVLVKIPCPHCNGEGRILDHPSRLERYRRNCRTCDGNGKVERWQVIDIPDQTVKA